MLGGWCCGAIIILAIREVGSIVKYDVRVTFASGRFLELITFMGTRILFFRKWWYRIYRN